MAEMRGTVKTVHYFAPVRPESFPSVEVLSVSKRRKIVLLSNGSEFIYLVEEDKIIHTFRFPLPIIRALFQHYSGNSYVFAATVDGHIHAVPLPQDLIKRKRSKKHKAITDAVTQDSRTTHSCSNDDDIFAGLLGRSTSNNNPSSEASIASSTSSQSITVIDIGSSAVLYQPGIMTFIPVKDKLLCFTASDSACVLSMFSRTSLDNVVAYSPVPMFRRSLDLLSVIEVSHVPRSQNLPHGKNFLQLSCVQPSNTCSLSCSVCGVIEREFFNKLFGNEASLLDTPVVLVGGADGQICFWPVNDFVLSKPSTTSESQMLGSKGTCISSLRLLYHLEQKVSAIHLAKLPSNNSSSGSYPKACGVDEPEKNGLATNNSPSSGCNALVFIGSRDKIVIASESKSSSVKDAVVFAEHSVIGPVMCSCLTCRADTLIHSTGKEIFITGLNLPDSSKHNETAPVMLEYISLQIPNVCSICCEPGRSSSTVEAKMQDEIIALTLSGKVLQLSAPELQTPVTDSVIIMPEFSPEVAGQKMKDYLCEIEAQSVSLRRVNAAMETEDKILKELNTIIHIACELVENRRDLENSTKSGQEFSSLSCTFTPNVVCHSSNGESIVNLHCRIARQGFFSVSSYWSLLVEIEGRETWLQKDGVKINTIGHSIPLQTLDSGAFVGFDIPLSKSLVSSFHISAKAYLYGNLNSLLSEFTEVSLPGFFISGKVEDILIPIQNQVFDVLDFVQPYKTGSHVSVQDGVCSSVQGLLKTLDNIHSKLPSTKRQNLSTWVDSSTHPKQQCMHGLYSTILGVSEDTVNFINDCIQNELHQLMEMAGSGATVEAAVLCFILKKSGISLQGIKNDSPNISLLTASGDYAAIRVKSVTRRCQSRHAVQQISQAIPGISCVELTLQCATVPLLCRLHEAVLTRLKPAVERDSKQCAVQTKDAQKALEKLQKLQDDIMVFEDAMSHRQTDHPHRDLKKKLWKIYEELRKIALFL